MPIRRAERTIQPVRSLIVSQPGDDIARVTVIAPHRRIDLALPGQALLGEIMPNIVRLAEGDAAPTADAVHTWVLQRVGSDPLDPHQLVSTLAIRDGETLHLRQREATMPDVAFDDVVDAVSSAASARPSWQPIHSRRMALGALAVLVVGGALLLLLGEAYWATAGAVGLLGLATGIAAVVASRAYGKAEVAATLAWSCVALVAMTGFFAMKPDPLTLKAAWSSPSMSLMVLVAAAAGLLAAGTMALAAHVHVSGLLTACLVLATLVLCGVALAFSPTATAQVAAVAIAVLLAIMPLMPWASYTVAQIAMPNLPSQVELLVADDEPVQADIVARATTADRLLACQLTAASIVITLLSVPLVSSDRLGAILLACATSLALLLRARTFVGLSQRLALLLGGLAVAALAGGWLLLHPGTGSVRLIVTTLVVLVLGAALSLYAGVFHAKVMAPIWGRLGDILEWIAIIAIIPLVLWVLDVYTLARGLPG